MTKAHIAVIGAGLMGHGIALTFARAGHLVRVTDPVAEARAALPARVTDSPDERASAMLPPPMEWPTAACRGPNRALTSINASANR